MSTNTMNIGALEILPDPVAAEALQRRRDERRELFRRLGESNLEAHRLGRKFSPEALADSRKWAAYPPLSGPLSCGEPQA